MRISDWSSDVCSSDLVAGPEREEPAADALIAVAHEGEWPLDAVAVGCLAGVGIGESGVVYGDAWLAFAIAAWDVRAVKAVQPLAFEILQCRRIGIAGCEHCQPDRQRPQPGMDWKTKSFQRRDLPIDAVLGSSDPPPRPTPRGNTFPCHPSFQG